MKKKRGTKLKARVRVRPTGRPIIQLNTRMRASFTSGQAKVFAVEQQEDLAGPISPRPPPSAGWPSR